MISTLAEFLGEHRDAIYPLLRHYLALGKPLLLGGELRDEFQRFCEANGGAPCAEQLRNTSFAKLIETTQEAVVDAPWIVLAVRPWIGRWNYIRFHAEAMEHQEIEVAEFLKLKERLVTRQPADEWLLEIDLGPFNREFPKLQESRSVGRGVEFLNRRLSSTLFDELGKGDRKLLEFLRLHEVRGQQLMLNGSIQDVAGLRDALRHAEEYLSSQLPDAGWDTVRGAMEYWGFEPGWGGTARRMRETLGLLSDILEAPEPGNLERFLARIPMMFSLVILSPHGYFGQSRVLGLPDTGGQVVYILDQVRALEKDLRRRIEEFGLDIQPEILVVTRLIPEAGHTTCDRPEEHIMGTENAKIVRVPFRGESGEIVPQWLSRFEVWPIWSALRWTPSARSWRVSASAPT